MDTGEIWGILAAIQIGTIVKVIGIIGTIAGVASASAIKLYKFVCKYNGIKKEKEDLKDAVSHHETALQSINDQLKLIIKRLDSQDETTMKSLRASLVRDGERYVAEGSMTIRQWKVWLEQYEEYHDPKKFGQNSYVESLRRIIENSVTIVGKLDEHGNDIE